jgi:glucose/arabinose dehydrogenase
MRLPDLCWVGVLGLLGCAESETFTVPSDLEVLDGAMEVCDVADPGTTVLVDTIASGLEIPWDVTFLPDGRALITERKGRIRTMTAAGDLIAEPWAKLDVFAGDEVGLMGIDASPDSRHVFVLAAVQDADGMGLLKRIGRRVSRTINEERGHLTTLRVVRLTDRDGRGVDPQFILDDMPSGNIHGGGALRFGPDGMLYFSDGDSGDPMRAQQASTVRGKLLRILPDGGVPSTNPLPGSPVYASGLRHSQGMDWHPETAELFLIDHGPTGLPTEGLRTGNDELNRVEPGANLGWPFAAGLTRGGGLTSPLAEWDPAIAPAGMTFYRGDFAAWQGSVFVTALRGASLRRIQLSHEADRWAAICEEVIDIGSTGRLRLVANAPDGSMWVGTSNRDGRGIPGERDDVILRVRVATETEQH